MKTIRSISRSRLPILAVTLPALALAGCVGTGSELEEAVTPLSYGPSQECLARAMYFESNRSSESGMLAVGTVVMNRVESGEYPSDVCAVVAQPKQFAPGVMTRSMGAGKDLAMDTAHKVLSGARHEPVREARFFHTAGLSFPYSNMHYTAIAGGNAFYEKVSPRHRPDFKHASQAEVAAGASDAIDGMRQGVTTAVPEPTAVAARPVRKPAEQSPFMALWSGLARKDAPNPASPAATAPAPAVDASSVPAATAADTASVAPAENAALPGVTTATTVPAAETQIAASPSTTDGMAERGGRVASPSPRP